MDAEMLAFFPNGIRALLVDDDSNFLKSATIMLSKFQYKVATCGSPNSAMKLLSNDRVKDVDVVLVDAHKVSVCGFDFCGIVENALNIPIIYFMSSTENSAAAGDSQLRSRLACVVQSATFILRKPFDAGELSGLWRAVAWRRCVLGNTTRSKDILGNINVARASSNGAGRRRNNRGGGDDGIDGGAGSFGSQKQQVVWTPCLKKKFEHALKCVGTGGHTSDILEHMNVKGLRRQHVASHLQRYRMRLENKKNARCGGAPSPCSNGNPQIFTRGGGPSNVIDLDAAEGFTGENDATATALPSSWACQPPLFREPSGNSFIAGTPAPAVLPTTRDEQQSSSSIIQPRNNVVTTMALSSGNGATSAMLPSWSPSFRTPAVGDGVSSGNTVPAVAMEAAHDHHILFAPFTYEDPVLPPPAPTMFDVQGEVEHQQAMAAAAAADQEVAEMVAELVASPDDMNGLAVPPYDDIELGAIAIADNEGITFAQLEEFLQMEDESMAIDSSAAAAAKGTRNVMNGDEGGSGSKNWDLETYNGSLFVEEILRDNTGDDAPE